MGTAEENNDNAPVAFALVTAAGLSTCIGAAFVFNTRLVRKNEAVPLTYECTLLGHAYLSLTQYSMRIIAFPPLIHNIQHMFVPFMCMPVLL